MNLKFKRKISKKDIHQDFSHADNMGDDDSLERDQTIEDEHEEMPILLKK
jgi:hypothetical protein